jgi:hypothetical protein
VFGLNVKVDRGGTVKVALAASSVGVPVTMTWYTLPAVDATMNDPAIVPPGEDMVHAGVEIRPLGDEDTPQPVSPAAKPEPVMVTTVPARPELSDRVIPGVTKKFVSWKSPIGCPVTFTA